MRIGFTWVRVPATEVAIGVMTTVAGTAVALLVYGALEPVVAWPWAVAIGTACFSFTQVGLTSIVVLVTSSGAATVREDLGRSLRVVTAASAGLLVAGTLAALAVDAGDTTSSLAALITVYALVCYGMTTAATARDRHAALVAMASELNAPMRRREVAAGITETACRLLHCDEVLLADTARTSLTTGTRCSSTSRPSRRCRSPSGVRGPVVRCEPPRADPEDRRPVRHAAARGNPGRPGRRPPRPRPRRARPAAGRHVQRLAEPVRRG